MTRFAKNQVELLANSGWSRCPSVAKVVADAKLPAITPGYVRDALSPGKWHLAERAAIALQEKFASHRFAEETTFGLLLVPDPRRLDTRRPMSGAVRSSQLRLATPDVFDQRLPAGTLTIEPGRAWTPVISITGPYGLACGSYDEIWAAPDSVFTVLGIDTRALMVRQLWGARVLQSGNRLPDCEKNERWTFTLFAGESLCAGLAESGTVLKGKVRFRLGKSNRSIASARIAPALLVA